MNRVVLDASAILAVVNREPGHEKLTPQLLLHAVASTVNVAEAHSKLIARGWSSEEAWKDARGLVSDTVPFDDRHARLTGDLLPKTQVFRLSFGDRACLALGIALRAPIYTAERTWRQLRLDVAVHLIR